MTYWIVQRGRLFTVDMCEKQYKHKWLLTSGKTITKTSPRFQFKRDAIEWDKQNRRNK